jgi:hypothetical protein
MLGSLLIPAVIQLIAACVCFASKYVKSGLLAFLLCGFVSFFASLTLLAQFLALAITGIASGVLCRTLHATPRYFWVAGGLASLLIVIAFGFLGLDEFDDLKNRYPIESMSDRLAYESGHTVPADEPEAPAHTKQPDALIRGQLAELDRDYTGHSDFLDESRTQLLSVIHASTVRQFINSPGFGVGRQLSSTLILRAGHQPKEPVPMDNDDSPPKPDASAQEEQRLAIAQAPVQVASAILPRLETVHREAQLDFANVAGFGYIQDRSHVVGFEPHRISRFPEAFFVPWTSGERQPEERACTHRIELVSLLKHAQPMVYLSKNLPRMEELRSAPVRPLDAFEAESLPALRAGGTIQTRDYGDRIRMLGAIRAAKQCLACHAVEHGALLGAFSYELGFCSPAGCAKPSETEPPTPQ